MFPRNLRADLDYPSVILRVRANPLHPFSVASYALVWCFAFSFPEAAILLVSDGDRDLWLGPTPEVRDSRTCRHSAHAQSQV